MQTTLRLFGAACLLFAPTLSGADELTAVVVARDAVQPQAAIDSEGTVYVTFIQGGNISVAVSQDGGRSFGEPVVAIDAKGHAEGGMHRGPRIGVDAGGTLTVTAPITFDENELKKQFPTRELFLVRSKDRGKTWSEPLQVNDVTGQAPEALHWMAVAPKGDVHVAWLDRRSRTGDGQDIYYAKVSDGKVGQNRLIARTVCECCAPALALDADGKVFVAYREGGKNPSREIFLTSSQEGGESFTEPVRINHMETAEDSCPMSAPAVAVLMGQKFAIAWKHVRTGEPNISWVISDTPRFGHEEQLHAVLKGEQNHPALAIDDTSVVWAVWEDSRTGKSCVWVRSSVEGDTGRAVSDGSLSSASFPSVVCRAGMTALVYEAKAKARNVVVFHRLK